MGAGKEKKLRVLREDTVPELPIVVADYLQHFACIGPRCEDTCCAGWSCISVDQQTYQQSLQTEDPELAGLFREKYVEQPGQSDERCIQLNNDTTCPFHGADKMCGIQKKLGPDALSLTCQLYPRITQSVQGVYERSASLSCPEAARLALLNPQGISFVVDEIPPPRNLSFQAAITPGRVQQEDSLEEQLLELRTLAIEILQDRRMPLMRRLIVLGRTCEAVSTALEEHAVPMLRPIIAASRRAAERGMDSTPPPLPAVAYHAQLMLLLDIVSNTRHQTPASSRFRACRDEVALGLKLDGVLIPKRTLKLFRQAYTRHFLPFREEHEYIFENYLVNQVFKNVFPTRGCVTVFDSFAALVLSLSIIQTMLTGLAAHHGKLDCDLVVRLVQSFSKSFEHRAGGWPEIICDLRARRRMNLEYLKMLLWPEQRVPLRRWFR